MFSCNSLSNLNAKTSNLLMSCMVNFDLVAVANGGKDLVALVTPPGWHGKSITTCNDCAIHVRTLYTARKWSGWSQNVGT